MRSTLALALLLALAPSAVRAADEAPKVPADGAPPVKTASGLEYSVLTAGAEGRKPKLTDSVTVHYTGWTKVDGKDRVFDSSRARGKPMEFGVGDLIKGWTEALQLMTVGARWKLTIPPDLGYGDQSGDPSIPPGSTLVFDVELLSIRGNPTFAFRAADPAKQTTTASGLKYEVITEGQGRNATENDVVEMGYALWTTAGKLLQTSTPTPGARTAAIIKVLVKNLGLPALKEAALLMKEGTRLRIEAPPALAFGAQSQPDLPPNSVTVWELEMFGMQELKLPEFQRSAPGAAVKTPSGLEIETLRVGTGDRSPKQGDLVTVHYAGWFTNGTLFDSSYGRGDTAQFRVGEVVEGWNEALKGMKEGGKVRLTIPPALAYGSQGQPRSTPPIPPNTTLIFYVELLKIGS